VAASALLVAAAATVVLASATWSAAESLQRMEAGRDLYAPLTPREREEKVVRALGFDVGVWRQIGSSIGPDDRYTVVSDAFEQHEVRNYAAYALLPAVQVPLEDATVVLYWGSSAPSRARCERLAANACLERRPVS
jgi:hypothetical protein